MTGDPTSAETWMARLETRLAQIERRFGIYREAPANMRIEQRAEHLASRLDVVEQIEAAQ